MKTDNELIVEFMGYVNTTITDKDFNIYEHPETKKVIGIAYPYHRSWDELMPVVEKIESDERFDVCIYQYGTIIHDQHGNEIVNNVAQTSFDLKIDHTHKAVVEFIKWYNNLNK